MSALKPPSPSLLSKAPTTINVNNSKMTGTTLAQANATATARQIAHFRAIPWCASHLAPSPSLVIDQSVSRRLTPTARDTLLSRALNTPDAIPAYITFYNVPLLPSPAPAPAAPAPAAGSSSTSQEGQGVGLIREVKSFLALGPMLNGWEGICHGGIVVTMLDEVMGQVFAANKMQGLMVEVPVMTGYLNTRFERPVRTGTVEEPAVVLVTGRLVRQEGRKYWMEGDVQGEGGVVLARGEALFVMLRGKL